MSISGGIFTGSWVPPKILPVRTGTQLRAISGMTAMLFLWAGEEIYRPDAILQPITEKRDTQRFFVPKYSK